jgi:outer membrane autotransporter protein
VPQAQLAWTHVDFNSFADINGARVSLGNGDSLKGRAGVRVDKLVSWKADDGSVRRLQLYGIANLTDEFLEGTKLDVASVSFTQQNKRLWGEVGLGGTYAWNDKWSVYGEASYATALSSHAGSDNYTVKSTVGLRYRW